MHHSRALILKKEVWREADWRVTALSADFGKVRLLAQGARKHGAKLQGHLEPGAVSDISFVIGKNGYRLTTARLLAFPAASRGSLPKLGALSMMLGTLDQNLLEERDHSAELLATVEAALSALEAAGDSAGVRRITMWFCGRFLAFLGLFPSPVSPEARSIPSLLALLTIPPAASGAAEIAPEALEREFAWLAWRLGSAFSPVGPVSSAA